MDFTIKNGDFPIFSIVMLVYQRVKPWTSMNIHTVNSRIVMRHDFSMAFSLWTNHNQSTKRPTFNQPVLSMETFSSSVSSFFLRGVQNSSKIYQECAIWNISKTWEKEFTNCVHDVHDDKFTINNFMFMFLNWKHDLMWHWWNPAPAQGQKKHFFNPIVASLTCGLPPSPEFQRNHVCSASTTVRWPSGFLCVKSMSQLA